MSRRCLLHISGNRFPPFPAQHHTRRIWEELAQDYDEYHVVARGLNNGYSHTAHGNIHLHLLPALGIRMWPFFFLSLVLPVFFLRYRPTVVIAQCPVIGGFCAGACATLLRVPLLVEIHGSQYFFPIRAGWKGRLEHCCYRFLSLPAIFAAGRIRSLSEDMSGHILRTFGKRAFEKTTVVPTRVDLDVFRYRKNDYSITGPIKVLSIGSFSPTKNHLALIEDLLNTGMDIQLTLVGSGPLGPEYRALAARMKAADKLQVLENLSHARLAPLLVEYDIYVHYSLAEALSRAILEAMAAGLPVVATQAGFMAGILSNYHNAIVIERPCRGALAPAVKQLASSQPLREALGVAARTTIEEQFEWHSVFTRYRNVLSALGR